MKKNDDGRRVDEDAGEKTEILLNRKNEAKLFMRRFIIHSTVRVTIPDSCIIYERHLLQSTNYLFRFST